LRIVLAVAARPRLWTTAVRQWWRMVPTSWWRHRPFLPVPSSDYLHFRMVTQYGTAQRRPDAADVLNYLAWCKRVDT
jgi:hypothetical protein